MNYAQTGEDAIILELLERIATERSHFVDVGANGKKGSNTYALAERGWTGIGIEADLQNARGLRRDYASIDPDLRRLIPICHRVTCEPGCTLADLVAASGLGDPSVLSIDVDGLDFFIWRSYGGRPEIVVIERNPAVCPTEKWVQSYDPMYSWDGSGYYGASAQSLVDLARAKGYVLHAAPGVNLVFVRADWAGRLELPELEVAGLKQWEPHGPFRSSPRG